MRRWQTEALAEWERNRHGSPVIWAIMGAGKSITIATMCSRVPDQVVVTAPTIALVDQLSATIAIVTGEPVGRWYTHAKTRERITVACHNSLDSLNASPALWIADEAHKTECDEVKAWAERTPIRERVGFTATPWRANERESLTLFDRCIYEYGPQQALADGVVVMPRLVFPQEAKPLDEQCIEFIEAQTTPGVVNARSIEDAERFSAKLSVPNIVVHSRSEYTADDARAYLSAGDHRCVVYVNMLAEGFDCPQIMWVCARRPVGSRVRFAQEIGRGLRAHAGKTECLVFDPHRLFQRLSLSYEACLGDVPPVDEPIPTLKLDEIEPELAESIVRVSPKNPLIRPYVADYLYELRCELQFRGVLEMKLDGRAAQRSASWRRRDVSEKQVAYIRNLYQRARRFAPMWPARVRDVLRAIWHHVPDLESGVAADLISVLTVADKLVDSP